MNFGRLRFGFAPVLESECLDASSSLSSSLELGPDSEAHLGSGVTRGKPKLPRANILLKIERPWKVFGAGWVTSRSASLVQASLILNIAAVAASVTRYIGQSVLSRSMNNYASGLLRCVLGLREGSVSFNPASMDTGGCQASRVSLFRSYSDFSFSFFLLFPHSSSFWSVLLGLRKKPIRPDV